MGLGVFIHRPDSVYDDSPAERYQFPQQYLTRVQACLGDWIVYYEPRKITGTRGYFAIARVQDVIPDPSVAGMFVAVIEPGSYLDFARAVPFADESGVLERGVLNEEGRTRDVRSPQFDRSHRLISIVSSASALAWTNDMLCCREWTSESLIPALLSSKRPSHSNRCGSGWLLSPRGSSEIAFSDALFSVPTMSVVR